MPLSPEDSERLDAYFDGDLTAEEAAAFRAWLRADSEHTREFARRAKLHQSLRDAFKNRRILHAEAPEGSLATEPQARVWNLKKWSAVATLALALGYAAYLAIGSDPKLAIYSARIDKVIGPVVIVDQTGADRLPAQQGKYLNAHSSLEFEGPGQSILQYRDGTTLNFAVSSGRAALRLIRDDDRAINLARAGKRVTIDNGTLIVDAAAQPPSSPLIIATPQAEITVIGTRFRLDVTPASTRLDVAHGKVRIARYADNASTEVSTGEGLTLTPQGPLIVKPSNAPFPEPKYVQ